MDWLDDPTNRAHVEAIRGRLKRQDGRAVLFLGAGLSFGASRLGRRSLGERDEWGVDDTATPPDEHRGSWHAPEVIQNDDGEPFPTWSRLKSRMRKQLSLIPNRDQSSLNRFFSESDPLDCAQVFRNIVGDTNYYEFLRQQFNPDSPAYYWVTPSHDALVDLDLPLLFTTNYDSLIERAYVHHGKPLTVSTTAQEFVGHRNPVRERHLVKLHGTIDRPDTVVLTRDDYTKARVERQRIYQHLRFEVERI